MKCQKCGSEFEGKFCPECGTPAPEMQATQQPVPPTYPSQVPVPVPEKKKRGCLSIGLAVLAVIIVIVLIAQSCSGGAGGVSSSASSIAASKPTISAASQTAPSSQAQTPSSTVQQKTFSATLLPGYYEIGVDIPAGTYDFDIASGKGNVTDIEDGINLIMGNDSKNDMYQKSYKNAELTNGSTLFLQQCSIKVTSSDAGTTQKRDNSTAKAVTFSSGKYTVGKDFQPGYYDITLVSGSGNVICMENQLNSIFSNNKGLGVTAYKNVPFKDGYKLDVEGAKVSLTPSK